MDKNVELLKYFTEHYYDSWEYRDKDYNKHYKNRPPIANYYCDNGFKYTFNIKIAMFINDLGNYDIPFFVID